MGFENFSAEPVVPNESERIEDPALAEQMAYAGKNKRDEAVSYRKIINGEDPIELKDGKKWVGGLGFDANMSDEAIRASFASSEEHVDSVADKWEDQERFKN
jgi:hypothetical protein